MSNKLSFSKSTFGNIYDLAMQTQLQITGDNLSAIRQARKESLESVAAAVNLPPDVLESIENGRCDFKLHALFALCNYYETDLGDVVKHSGLMQLKIA
jgi:transcriptional regulator with XRE-family HTH domain